MRILRWSYLSPWESLGLPLQWLAILRHWEDNFKVSFSKYISISEMVFCTQNMIQNSLIYRIFIKPLFFFLSFHTNKDTKLFLTFPSLDLFCLKIKRKTALSESKQLHLALWVKLFCEWSEFALACALDLKYFHSSKVEQYRNCWVSLFAKLSLLIMSHKLSQFLEVFW